LQAGDNWEVKLRRSIHQCSLFVPVISRQTLTSEARYFFVEWKLALKEDQMAPFSSEHAFLFPVVIDDTSIDHPDLPDRFREIQWKSLPGGVPTPDFVDRVKHLYRKRQLARTGAI
jgi:TIR domain